MNCDDVFNVLTRGPFPTGDASDTDVEFHLSECVECRRLAEALRPAIALFEEAVSAEEACILPGYWSDLPMQSASQAVTVASSTRQLKSVASPPLRRLQRSGAWRYAAAILIGTIGGVTGAVLGWPPIQAEATYAVAAVCLNESLLDQKPPASHRSDQLVSLNAAQVARMQCCTDCHTSDAKRSLATSSVAQILLTCNLCHAE